MNSAVVAETFSDTKKSEYIRFAEKLGVLHQTNGSVTPCGVLQLKKLEHIHYISTGYPPCIRTP